MSTLVVAAHGSRDPRSAATAHALVRQLTQLRPGLNVRVAFLAHNTPTLTDVLTDLPDTPHTVVCPLLLTHAYHARLDIPHHIGRAGHHRTRQAEVLGPDHRLLHVARHRLAALGVSRFDHQLGVVLAAAGSTEAAANAHTATIATQLATTTAWAATTVAFATGTGPSPAQAVAHLQRRGAHQIVIAPWFLAPGQLTDYIAAYAHHAGIPTTDPLGAHPLVAQTLLDRYHRALPQPAAA